jgi:hypothetical protein
MDTKSAGYPPAPVANLSRALAYIEVGRWFRSVKGLSSSPAVRELTND